MNWFFAVVVFVLTSFFGLMFYEAWKHPCIASHMERHWVEETTTYITVDGSSPMGPVTSNGGVSIPFTTPAHWETIEVCDRRK
jgi:hypothetical protein